MITDNINNIQSGNLEKKYNLNELYSENTIEDRLRLQRIAGYADILIEYMWRNRMFTNYLTPELFKYHREVYLYVCDNIDKEELSNLYFESMPEEEIEHIREIMDYKEEKWDGSGSPHGKKGEGIPFTARVYSLAKRYEELVFDNPYGIQEGNKGILDLISKESGSSFQPEMVSALKNCFALLQKKDVELGVII